MPIVIRPTDLEIQDGSEGEESAKWAAVARVVGGVAEQMAATKRQQQSEAKEQARYEQARADAEKRWMAQQELAAKDDRRADAYLGMAQQRQADERHDDQLAAQDPMAAGVRISQAQGMSGALSGGLGDQNLQPPHPIDAVMGRVGQVASQFSNKKDGARFAKEQASMLKGAVAEQAKAAEEQRRQEATSLMQQQIAHMGADPKVAGDPALAQRYAQIQTLAQHPDADPDQMLTAMGRLNEQASEWAAAREDATENRSRINAQIMELTAAADALERSGLSEDASALRDRLRQARAFAVRIDPQGSEFQKSGEFYQKAVEALKPPQRAAQGQREAVDPRGAAILKAAQADPRWSETTTLEQARAIVREYEDYFGQAEARSSGGAPMQPAPSAPPQGTPQAAGPQGPEQLASAARQAVKAAPEPQSPRKLAGEDFEKLVQVGMGSLAIDALGFDAAEVSKADQKRVIAEVTKRRKKQRGNLTGDQEGAWALKGSQ